MASSTRHLTGLLCVSDEVAIHDSSGGESLRANPKVAAEIARPS